MINLGLSFSNLFLVILSIY